MNEQIVIQNFQDIEYLNELMEKYGDSESPFFGKNQNDEHVIISICKDFICVETWQHNGWVRKNFYHSDGTVEELFDGKIE